MSSSVSNKTETNRPTSIRNGMNNMSKKNGTEHQPCGWSTVGSAGKDENIFSSRTGMVTT